MLLPGGSLYGRAAIDNIDEEKAGSGLSGTNRTAPASRGGSKAAEANHARRCAARNVFCINRAMVIGPTPPGTGVMAPATFTASS